VPIFLVDCAIEVRGWGTAHGYLKGSQPLPHELRPGRTFTFRYDAQDVQRLAAQKPHRLVRALYIDNVGRRYRSTFFIAATPTRTEEEGWTLTIPQRPSIPQRALARLRAALRVGTGRT
jgi:hypothetical protein